MDKQDFAEKLGKDIAFKIKGSEFLGTKKFLNQEMNKVHIIKIQRPPRDLLGKTRIEEAISDNYKVFKKGIINYISKGDQKYIFAMILKEKEYELIIS